MYTKSQRFLAIILFSSLLLQSCHNPNLKLEHEEVPKIPKSQQSDNPVTSFKPIPGVGTQQTLISNRAVSVEKVAEYLTEERRAKLDASHRRDEQRRRQEANREREERRTRLDEAYRREERRIQEVASREQEERRARLDEAYRRDEERRRREEARTMPAASNTSEVPLATQAQAARTQEDEDDNVEEIYTDYPAMYADASSPSTHPSPNETPATWQPLFAAGVATKPDSQEVTSVENSSAVSVQETFLTPSNINRKKTYGIVVPSGFLVDKGGNLQPCTYEEYNRRKKISRPSNLVRPLIGLALTKNATG